MINEKGTNDENNAADNLSSFGQQQQTNSSKTTSNEPGVVVGSPVLTTTPTTQRTRPKKMNSSREKVVIMMKKKERERMKNTTHNIRNMFLKQKLKGEEAGTQLEQTTPQCSDKTTSTVRTTTDVRPQVSPNITNNKNMVSPKIE